MQRLSHGLACTSKGAMLEGHRNWVVHLFTWHPNQKGMASCLLQALDRTEEHFRPKHLLHHISLAGCKVTLQSLSPSLLVLMTDSHNGQ